ncbi:MAG: type I asparaginase [Bacteroidaceae bacterium]|nr:type I asparaginase [Bacteroidaceae bacterium]
MKKLLLIYTGGTIGMSRNPRTGTLEPFSFSHLLANVPELTQLDAQIDNGQWADADGNPLPPIDSSDMSPELWIQLARTIAANYDAYDGFVILHGTDTMAYTASALSFMLENLTKPVILTGSQLPVGQLRTDGRENLITAVQIATATDSEGHALVPEVGICFGGALLRGNRTTKKSAEAFSAFASFNYPPLADVGVEITYHPDRILKPNTHTGLRTRKPDLDNVQCSIFNSQFSIQLDSRVIIFSLFPGIREDIIKHIIMAPGVRGIVMRTYGSGNAPQYPWLLRALRESTKSGKVIVNVSQCIQGRVEMSRYDCGYHLQEAGVISGRDITVESAVTKLMYLLARYPDEPDAVRQLMTRSLRGEMTE